MGQTEHKLRVAVIGCGEFAKHFVPLFIAHPTVEWVGVCDLIEERAQDYKNRFGTEVIASFEDAIAILSAECRTGDVIVVMGAGTVYRIFPHMGL